MNKLLFSIRRIFAVPIEMIGGPLGLTNSVFDESSKGRSMVLGLPAIVVGLLGISLVVWAFFGNRDSLERQYDVQAKKYLEDLQTVTASISANARGSKEELEELREEFETTRQTALIYLNKLISIDPENNEYQYKLARTTFAGPKPEDKSRGLELMQNIAPEDEPGYAPAHLWLATALRTQLIDPQRGVIRKQVANKTLTHLNYCLDRDPNNAAAIAMRATILRGMGRVNEAYTGFKKLFETDPFVYQVLHAIDKSRLERGAGLSEDERQEYRVGMSTVLDEAETRFNDRINKLRRDDADQAEWTRNWQSLANIYVLKGKEEDFKKADKKLTDEYKALLEISEKEKTPSAASRVRTLKTLLVGVKLAWSDRLGAIYNEDGIRIGAIPMEKAPLEEQLSKLKEALGLAPNNVDTLSRIANLALSDSRISEKAKALYDPENDPNAPATVLSQLGTRALQAQKYDEAIKYFDQARNTSKGNPTILNNLAYAYLVKENPNPDRALNLVNEAIRMLSRSNPAIRQQYASNFYDTQGNALLQMNNPQQAVESFLKALQTRPNKASILEGVVESYKRLGNEKQAEVYQKMLDRAKAAEDERKAKNSANNN